ncbi:hypothetical protein N7536_007462 [Penicillium majusculum]|nr:hypothetical protein N7536_007462 [Penicillium majusculum]
MASLNTIPTELECAIFRLLDPVGLISVSQTNRHFQKIIQPTRNHFVERLVQLECDEEVGGISPLLNSTNNALSPDWTQPEWKAMRWACSRCLRLLPEENFDNHSILRLAYRKPIPSSPASEHRTTWESTPESNPFLPHSRREERSQSDQCIKEKQTRRRYALASSKKWGAMSFSFGIENTYYELQDCGWTVFENMTLTEFIKLDADDKKFLFKAEVEAIERMRCGYKRHLRKCHECRYQSGQLKPTLIGSDGTAKIAFATSRQYRIPTATDRYYPRFSEKLKNKRPVNHPPSYAVYRIYVRDRFWTMYMMRCPDCEKWKEQRIFMLNNTYSRSTTFPKKTPGIITKTTRVPKKNKANKVEKIYSRKDKSTKCAAINATRENLTYRLGHGFHSLLFEPELKKFPKSIQEEIHSIADEADRLAKSKQRQRGGIFTPAELAFLSERYTKWMEIRARLLALGKAKLVRQREEEDTASWLYAWTYMYEDIDSFYKWLLAAYDEVEKKAEKVAEWALHGSIGGMPPVCIEHYTRLPW